MWMQVRTIKSVEEGGRRVVLTQALLWPHYGGAEYQAEVGLLSRSITLSSPLEAEKTKRGGHVHVSYSQPFCLLLKMYDSLLSNGNFCAEIHIKASTISIQAVKGFRICR
jgi:hypothetical protein